MRSTTRPTTACCTLPQYMGFLISEPKSSTCTRLAEVTGISHHSANRFLHRENYQSKDMYDEDLDIPDNGLEVFLKDFGKVTLFRTMLKDQRRHYVVYLPEDIHFERNDFSEIHDQHWQIEQYHRAIKQVCHIEHFHVRSEQPVRNHILAASSAFVYLQKMQMA